MADLDLLDLLAADHRNLLSGPGRPLVAEIAQHLSVERDLLYPALHRCGVRGEEIVRGLRREERALEQRMADFEADPSPEQGDRLRSALRWHADSQDEVFAEARRLLPAGRLAAAVDSVPLSIGGSPTRAHASLAQGGAVAEVVEDVTSVSDHLRDRLQHAQPDQG